MLKILWLSPNFNHYKARFLNHLASEKEIDLTVICGVASKDLGHEEIESEWKFNLQKIDVKKANFGMSATVRKELKTQFKDYDWILIPAEKKNIFLFLYALYLRNLKKNVNTRLFSYNHPILKSKNGVSRFSDKLITKFFNRRLNRVIYYTKESHEWAINNKLIDNKKAFWANNTIDNTEINKNYTFKLPPEDEFRMLFIGRLIASKRLDCLFRYFMALEKDIPNLKLDIIGDGPERSMVDSNVKKSKNIKWYGTLINEAEIAPIMTKVSFVFVPGHSGLSINHAFAYGRPYLTTKVAKHAPELDYLSPGENGYILEGDLDKDIQIIKELIFDRVKLEQFCINAKQKGEELSVENWVKQVKNSLLHE